MTIRMLTWGGRYVAATAAAVLALGGAGAAVAWHDVTAGKTHARTLSAYCGLVACAVLHADGTVTATPAESAPTGGSRSGGRQARLRTSPTPAASSAVPAAAPTVAPTTPAAPAPTAPPAPSPTPSPVPTPAPSPTPDPAGPAVTVSFSVLRQWPGGFLGQLTIVNQGGSAVNGWQMAITLPGDQVQNVWNANWQPAGWGSVIMTPVPDDQVIEPGASAAVNLVAQGNPTEPASCTFNGSPCSS
jgi:Cellulose binding domain